MRGPSHPWLSVLSGFVSGAADTPQITGVAVALTLRAFRADAAAMPSEARPIAFGSGQDRTRPLCVGAHLILSSMPLGVMDVKSHS